MTTWQKKASAPATFNLAEAFAAAITGDPTWGWLSGWLPLLGSITVETAPFCSKGPAIGLEPLEPGDFITGDRNPLAALTNKGALMLKLRDAAYDFMFAAYCEGVYDGPAGGYWWNKGAHSCAMQPTEPGVFVDTGPFTAGTYTKVRLKFDQATITTARTRCWLTAWPSGTALMDTETVDAWATSREISLPVGTTQVQGQIKASMGDNICFWLQLLGDVPPPTAYTAVPEPRPTGVLSPTVRSYGTIADLGRELDAQELKLDQLLTMVQWILSQTNSPVLLEDLPEEWTGAVIARQAAVGFVVHLFGVPAGVSEDFPLPGRLHKAGYATLQTATGSLPPIELAQLSTVIAPVPPWVTGVMVNLYPPTTATVSRLRPTK